MIRSPALLSRNSRTTTRRRRRHRALVLQALDERKMMTVAASVWPTETAAIVAQHPAVEVAGNQGGGNQGGGNQGGGNQGGGNQGGGGAVGGGQVAGVQPGNQGGDGSPEQTQSNPPTGATIQLPTIAVTGVQTTVRVPDGGTVLLGGILRLSEGRSERGVPLLSKIPYLSRLFQNISDGRDGDRLMLMVTPRIIIQQEEE